MDRFPAPGSPNFLANLSHTIKRLYGSSGSIPSNTPFNEQIFAWILFCLAVGDKHLILRTKDITGVQKIAKSILYSIFGMTTVSLRVKPEFTPEDLLLGIFLNAPWNSASSPGLSGLSSSAIPAERKIRPRQNSLLALSQAGRSSSYTRGSLFFADRDRDRDREKERPSHFSPFPSEQPRYRLSVAATVDDDDHDSVKGLRPLSGRGFSPPDTEDMFSSITSDRDALSPGGQSQSMATAQLPHAIVISGLETASSAVQETLWDVLRTRTVVLEEADGGHGNVWNLPDGFILVYVCPLGDGSSRPAIQNALLDRFSFHANIVLQVSPTPPGIQAPGSPLLRRTALLSRDYIEQIQHHVHMASISEALSLYIANLVSSIRYHPQLDATLVTSRCSKDIIEFTKASSVFAGNSDAGGLNRSANVSTSNGIGANANGGGVGRVPMTPEDVKRIIRHVVGHRVNVREGVHDEILGSLVCTAIKQAMEDESVARRTIKEILDEAIVIV